MSLKRTPLFLFLIFLLTFVIAACNLTGNSEEGPDEGIDVTNVPTNTVIPTRTPISNAGVPTRNSPTPLPTRRAQLPPTSAGQTGFTPIPAQPTNTPVPISIYILSPIPGNVVAGNVQVIGSATHPQFLQYQLEYGPDPNPGDLWFPVDNARANQVSNDLLGLWNTSVVSDGLYQLRLRMFLRDGSEYSNVSVSNIRVQNQAPTPAPTNTPIIPAPISAFTQNRTQGDAPLVVQFTNQSIGEINNYLWEFGDGSTSGALNPTHTFDEPGTYNVRLTARGPGGVSNVSRQINVNSPAAPVASFTADETSGTAPLTVLFSSTSTGEIENYQWNFGDGENAFGPNVTHVFDEVGTYNIILTVTGPGGSSTATRQITVEDPQVPPPVANFGPDEPISGDAPLQVQFVDESTGEIEQYNWDFGDGSPTSGEENPLHVYTEAGEYTVTLTVVGPGGQDTAQKPVEVIQPPDVPVAAFSIVGETSGEVPFTVRFSNESTGEIDRYQWVFGDGEQSTSGDPTVTHQYTEPGTYTVMLTVGNEAGNDTAQATVNVLTQLAEPEALFTANPNSGAAPLTVEFDNQSSGDSLSFLWEFGDGEQSTSSEPTVTHIYTEPGVYTARLTASNEERGLSDSFEVQINVSEPVVVIPDLTANFTVDQSNSNPLRFNMSAVAAGGVPPYTYTWDFGDGVGPQVLDANTSVTYAQPGQYTITLTVTDNAGTTVNAPPQQVEATAPVEDLQASFTAIQSAENPLAFDLAANVMGGVEPYTYTWDFGDGVGPQVLDANPTVTYPAAGQYTITLAVTDNAGTTVNAPPQQVEATAPVEDLQASFTATQSAENPLAFDLAANVTGGVEPYTYTWDFGDGTGPQVLDANPTVTYPAAGQYTITLTVTDNAGTTVNAPPQQVEATAPVEDLQASFTATQSAENPLAFDLAANVMGGVEPYTYTWDFGDGTGPQVLDANPAVTYPAAGQYTITLAVTDSADNTATAPPQQVEATAPVEDLQASFTAIQSAENPLAFDLAANVMGGVEPYTYTWDFGDGTGPQVLDANPTVTYPAAGTYTITLAVTDNAGTTVNAPPQQVEATAPVEDLQASFTATQSAENPLAFDLAANVMGGVEPYTYTWDFGDGAGPQVLDANPAVTYPAAGTYTITLSVADSAGTTVNAPPQQVEATAPAEEPEEDLTENTPVWPPIDDLLPGLRTLYQSGSTNPNAFAVIGGETAASENYLDPFATVDTLNDPNLQMANLLSVISRYQTDLGDGNNSFSRESVAAGEFTAAQLLEPLTEGECAGMNRINCELDAVNPSVAIINVGYNDIIQGTDPAAFEEQLREIIQTVVDRNVIPVVVTIYPVLGSEDETIAINNRIISVANDIRTPLINEWPPFQRFEASLDAEGNPTVAPEGPTLLSLEAEAGVSLRNILTLSRLEEIASQVLTGF